MTDQLERLKAALADRYRIERELGAGGMATVYLAEDLKHHRKVAVKVLRPDLAASLGPERFLREVTIAAGLTHPHILPLHDSGEADGFLFYVMPYVEGTSLRQKLIRERELPIPDAARILRDLADAMAYAHRHGVVHRDIKPENIMLADRHALVMDFGVAKAVSEATGRQTLTTAGVALGTPTYMAPEQAAADPHTDHRADIYAFGIVAYELLTGRPPFAGASPQAVLAAHVTIAADPVTKYRASIPAGLAALVMKCLEKKPADRWQGADELIPHLELALTPSGGITPTGMQPTAASPTVGAGRWRKWVLGGAAAAVVALGAVGAWVVLGSGGWRPDARMREPLVVLPFEVRGSRAGLEGLGVDAAERITAAIQQAGLGQVVRYQSDGGAERFTERLARRVLRETGAGTLVVGTIVERGEGVEVQASVVRGSDLVTLWTLGPERSLAADPSSAIDAIRERVLGAVGWYLSPATEGLTNPGIYQPPTSLAVLRLAARANELLLTGPQGQAIPILQEAFALDTTYLGAPLMLRPIYANLGRWQEQDSVLAFLEKRRSRLSPGQALLLDFGQATLGSPEQEYRAAVDLFSADSSQAYLALYSSVRALRPEEALGYFALRDTNTAWGRRWQAWDYQAGQAYHMLGRFEDELALAQSAKAKEPRAYGHWRREVTALAAMGRVADLERVLIESHTLEWVGAPVELLRWAAQELQLHGWDEQARAHSERALVAIDRLPDDVQDQLWAREVVRQCLVILGRFDEARRTATAEVRTHNIGLIGRVVMARYAALAGDTVGAAVLVDSMRTAPKDELLRGTSLLVRGWALMRGAEVLSLLGRREEAVTMLRDAFNNGARLESDASLNRSWAPVRDYPPFQELVRLRDGM